MFDFVLKNIQLVEGAGEIHRDIGIKAGAIAAIESELPTETKIIDCNGCLGVPGFVETHIHLDKACILDRCKSELGTLDEALTEVTRVKKEFTQNDIYTRARKTLEKCIANSVIDISSGFIVGIFLALIGSLILIDSVPGLFPVILIFFVLYITSLIVFIKKSGGSKIFKILIRPLIPKKYKERVDQSVESLYEDIPRFRDLLIPFLFEGTLWILTGTQVYIIAQAFSIPIDYITLVLISIISVVATGILPISVGGLGVREGTFMFLMATIAGVSHEIAFVISLSGYLVKNLIPALIGMIISFKKESLL